MAPFPFYIYGMSLTVRKSFDRKQYSNLEFTNRFHKKRESPERNYQRSTIVRQVRPKANGHAIFCAILLLITVPVCVA